MPSRLIREGILTSDRVDELDYGAEVFYRRLLSKVDDHGLYDARPAILRASLYPLRLDRVREADIVRWIAACVKADLIVLYEAGGKSYMQVLRTGWQARSEPKYPPPPTGIGEPPAGVVNGCKQVKTPVPVDVDVVVDGLSETETKASERARDPPRRKRRAPTPIPTEFSLSDRVRQWAAERDVDRLELRVEHFIGRARAKGYTYVDWDAALMNAIREDWAGLSKPSPPQAKKSKADLYSEICGRSDERSNTIEGVAERVDTATIHAIPIDLRKPRGDDVGECGQGGLVAGVG